MKFGFFLEFPAPDGYTDQQTFAQGFALVDEAESMGVYSVWLAEYHFAPFSILSAPLTVATALAVRTELIRLGFGVLLLPLNNPIRIAEGAATLDHISCEVHRRRRGAALASVRQSSQICPWSPTTSGN